MKKRYTKKQICEAIAYWKKQLKKLNENTDVDESFSEEFKDQVEKIEADIEDLDGISIYNDNENDEEHEFAAVLALKLRELKEDWKEYFV